MKLETFFAKFDLFADAPDSVARVRELVLELAVRGKLVPQDRNDEPAEELLRRLVKFKLANPLVGRSGRSKESSPEVEGQAAEVDSLPFNWVKATIGEVLYVIRGASPRPKGDPQYFSEVRTPFHWVKISDIRKHGQNGLLMDTDEFLTEAGMKKSVLLPKGTLVLTNSATIGVPIVLGVEGCCIHDGYLAFPNFPHELLSQKFVLYLFNTLKKHAEQNARGLAQLNLNTELVRSFPFGLPPLTEQKRIVAKVDELMALCDRLEEQQKEHESRHAALSRASLARFADAPTPANLQLLFHKSYDTTPADLRKSILTLAVQGKLVPQDPNDEPAKELPSVKGAEATFHEKEFPFKLPITWQWIKLGLVSELINGDRSKNYPNKAEYVQEGVPWINTGHIEPDGTLSVEMMNYITRKKFDSLRSGKIQLGDLVYCLRGATLGKTAIISQFDEGAIASSLVIIRLVSHMDSKFAYYFLTSPLGRQQIRKFDNGSAQPNLSASSVKKYWIPIPPLAEQRRIVAKVDVLMTLVGELESQLATARTTAKNLLEAVVAELTTTQVEAAAGIQPQGNIQ